MPDVRMPDGTIIKNVPEGTTKAQLAAKLQAAPEQEGFSGARMVQNIPSSAWQLAKDVTYPFIHPVETAKGLGNLAEGAVDLANPNIIGGEDKSDYARAVGQFLKDRYGSTEAILSTLENDPVGLLSDVGGLVSGGATVGAKMTGKGAKIAKAAEYLDPVVAAGRGLKAGPGSAVAKWLDPNDMMREVLKFNTTDAPDEHAKWAQTALDEKVVKGSDLTGKFTDKINRLTESLTEAIDAAAPETAVPVERVLAGLEELKANKTAFKIESAKDRDLIDAFKEDFLAEHGDRQYVTVREVQDFKTDVYDKVYNRRKKGKGRNTKEDIYTTVGRSAKEAIEEAEPSVKALNSQLGDLLDARDPLMQKWNRIDNRSKWSLTQMLMTGIGAGLGDTRGAAAGLLAGTVFRPENTARMAVALNELIKNGANARLVENQVLRGLTKAQVVQLEKLAGRYLQEVKDSEQGGEGE